MRVPRIVPARPWITAAAVVLGSALLAGCGSGGTTATSGASASSSPAASASASASAFPVRIDNCGFPLTVDAAPARAVTMNQSSTEVMLALGLEKSMVGTAYLDDDILPAYAAAYQGIPVLAEEYPSPEKVLETQPDFVYAAYPSAFAADAAGSRESLQAGGIDSYLSPTACPDKPKTTPLTMDDVWGEFTQVGQIFDVPDRAAALVAEQQAQVAAAAAKNANPKDISVFWWDDNLDAPSAGACCGAPGMIMSAVGVTNIFDGVEGSWADVSWEQVIQADPDAIIVVGASWSTAQDKIAHLQSDPATKGLTAVQNNAFVTVPFSATTPGVRNVSAIEQIADGLAALPAAG